MNKNQKNQPQAEKTRTVISKSPTKGTEMVVYRFKVKGRMHSETKHEITGPKTKKPRKSVND